MLLLLGFSIHFTCAVNAHLSETHLKKSIFLTYFQSSWQVLIWYHSSSCGIVTIIVWHSECLYRKEIYFQHLYIHIYRCVTWLSNYVNSIQVSHHSYVNWSGYQNVWDLGIKLPYSNYLILKVETICRPSELLKTTVDNWTMVHHFSNSCFIVRSICKPMTQFSAHTIYRHMDWFLCLKLILKCQDSNLALSSKCRQSV